MNKEVMKRFCAALEAGKQPDDGVMQAIYASFRRDLGKRRGRPRDTTRPFKKLPKVEQAACVLEAYEQLGKWKDACAQAGVSYDTFKSWKRNNNELIEAARTHIEFKRFINEVLNETPSTQFRKLMHDVDAAERKLTKFGFTIAPETPIPDVLRAARVIDSNLPPSKTGEKIRRIFSPK